MKFDNANQWLTLISNFAVIAGIVFLAVELQQNTKQLETQSYQAWVATNMEINTAIADPELSGIIARGHLNPRDLTRDTYVAYAMIHMSMLQMAQSTHYLYLQGSLDKELWEAEMYRAAAIINIPGVRQWWDAGAKTQLAPSFVDHIESLDPDVSETWSWDEKRGYYYDENL